MINPAQIPDEVVEAAARGLARYNCDQWDSDPERFWPHFADQARAAIAAALSAWPGMHVHETRRSWLGGFSERELMLPLPQEARDE
jgi:hypothetical protein